MYDSITASAISFKPTKWDKPGNCERLESLFVQAAQEKPDLILATEDALEGYDGTFGLGIDYQPQEDV